MFCSNKKKTMKLKIRKWDPKSMRRDSIVLLVGKRGTGKSCLMKDICYHMRDKVDFGVAMSPTEECTESMSQFLPSSWVYSDYNEKVVDTLLRTQRSQWKTGRGYNCFVLLDDCMYDKKILKSKTMRQLFMNGRHRRIFYILAMQYVLDMPPDLRSQVDYVFALRDTIISSREKLWKQFFGFFQTYSSFSTAMDSCTENYECLVYDGKAAKTNNIEDCIFWYKSEVNIDTFKMGSPVFWKLHDHYFHDREEEFEQMQEKENEAKLEKCKKSKIDGIIKQTTNG
jgi:hypothetical protein